MTQEEARRQYGFADAAQTPIVQQHTKEFNMKTLQDAQLQEQLGLFQKLLQARANVPGEAQQIQNHIAQIQGEIGSREVSKKQDESKAEIDRILGGAGSGTSVGNQEYEGRQRQNLDDIFSNAMTSGTNRLRENQASDRGRAIDEAAAMGLSRMPGYLTKTLGDIDARGSNSLRDLTLGLEGQRAQGRLGLEDTLFGRGTTQQGLNLQRASLMQGGNQFGQTFGLQKDMFGEQRNQNSLQNIFDNASLTQAGELGRMQADAAKPTFIDQFAKVTGGLGSLAGGIGSLTRPKRATAGVY